jgi:aerobic carbon-monoxide dehydrogenase medium subunit
VKPAPFKYARAETAEEASSLLTQYGDEAKILAGGQSLIPLLSMRLARPEVLVDISRVDALKGISRNGGLTIGAATTQSSALRSSDVQQYAPILAAALREVGHVGIRNRGTVGGSAAHADPASEIPAVLLALDAQLVATGPEGERSIPAEEFFVSTFTTSLEDDEVLTRIELPYPTDDARWSFLEVARRHGDFALAGVAATAEVDGSGVVRKARIALSGVSDTPVRAQEAEQALVGRQAGEGADEAAALAVQQLDPPSDVHGSRQYRLDAARALVARAIRNLANQEGAR